MMCHETDTDRDECLTRLFKALMHPARIEILDILREGEECVCHMEAHLGYRQAYISQQLAILREAGLIADRRDGWNVYYRVTDRRVFDLIDQARAIAGLGAPKLVDAAACPCPKCAVKSGAASVPVSDIRVAVPQ
jgi:ArsR family transcriptional regulator